ncbi:metallophosphoesterase family protein [Oceanobacillus sp. CAU 1775]
MNRDITFIHAADLHLDSPFKGLANTPEHIFKEIKESTFLALERLVATAIEKQVDFIVITGDLFDNEKQSLKAQIRLKKAFENLQENQINVYLSYGNHDYISGNIHEVAYPDNVYIFPDDTVRSFSFEKDGKALAAITGFSYVNRAVMQNKANEYRIQHPEATYQIAMLHGSIQGNNEHDTYAPFQLSDLTSKEFDYWALGHIHKREILAKDPLIVYPGNIQGRHRKETGAKGCYYVKLSSMEQKIDFISLQEILFLPLQIDVSDCTKAYQLESKIQEVFTNEKWDQSILIDLTLTATHDALRDWQSSGQLEEIIEVLNENNENKSPWIYVFRTKVQIEAEQKHISYFGEHFLGELQTSFEEAVIQEHLEELYNHRQARKYLDSFQEVDKQDILEEARNQLLNKLLKGEENQ